MYDNTQKNNISVKMINPWKEIHFICKDQVHKTSFPQWALILDRDTTQVRKPPTGKQQETTERTRIFKTPNRGEGQTLDG